MNHAPVIVLSNRILYDNMQIRKAGKSGRVIERRVGIRDIVC